MEIVALVAVIGAALLLGWVVLYRWGGLRDEDRGPEATGRWDTFLLRAYRGHEQADAMAAYARDAEVLVTQGYEPVGQSWGEGRWELATFVLALILCLFWVGVLLLVYMAIFRPEGTLLVTYRLRDDRAGASSVPAATS